MVLPKWYWPVLFSLLAGLLLPENNLIAATTMSIIKLPEPRTKDSSELDRLLQERRSRRDFSPGPISLAQLSKLLWSAQGITHASGLRSAPSAGALYPLELYVVALDVTDLETGLYHYQVNTHSLRRIHSNDLRRPLTEAALGQDAIEQAAVIIAITGSYARTERKYGPRAKRYVHIEVGHAAQNLYLQAAALELATVMIGAFEDHKVQQVLQLEPHLTPLALLPFGPLP